MNCMIWLLAAFFFAEAAELFDKDGLPKSHLSIVHPEVFKVFKSFLLRALEPKGSSYRDLLITKGIVPAPYGYESPKDDGSGKLEEIPPFSEVKDHFYKHVTDILMSLEKVDNTLNRLFGEWLLQSDFEDLKGKLHPKLIEHLKSSKSKIELDDESSNISEEASTEINYNTEVDNHIDPLSDGTEFKNPPEADLVKTEFEVISENEFPTSHSVADKIITDYVKSFSEMTESSTQPSNLWENNFSEHDDEANTLTSLDEFMKLIMPSSTTPVTDKSAAHFEKGITTTTNEFLSTPDSTFEDSNGLESIKAESEPPYHYGRVLTFEEIQLLDQSLSQKPELKYHVISSFQQNLDSLSEVKFFTTDETVHSPLVDELSSSKSIGKKRRRINPRGISFDEPIFYQAPTPQKMILRYYRDIPDTSFTCENKSIPGFYADQETDCQVFHVCWPGRRESFLCPVGSLFNQKVLSCDNFNNSGCELAHVYFNVNDAFHEYDDAKAHNVTPSPDPMMKPIQNDSGTAEVVITKSDIVELFEADLHFSDMVNKTNITELWAYIPVKAKVFVYPEPSDLKTFLAQHHHHHHKIRKSKDVRGIETTEPDDIPTGELDDVVEKRQRIEANIIRVLKKLSRKHRD